MKTLTFDPACARPGTMVTMLGPRDRGSRWLTHSTGLVLGRGGADWTVVVLWVDIDTGTLDIEEHHVANLEPVG